MLVFAGLLFKTRIISGQQDGCEVQFFPPIRVQSRKKRIAPKSTPTKIACKGCGDSALDRAVDYSALIIFSITFSLYNIGYVAFYV